MTNNLYVLAQYERKIELVEVDAAEGLQLGEEFERMPAREEQLWTVVKIFGLAQHARVAGLVNMIGFNAAKELFDLELPEPESPGLEFAETVRRMGGEA